MRKEYDIKNLNPRQNPYSNRVKQQVTINLNKNTVEYFKAESKRTGMPYQTLINLYLDDCVTNKRQINLTWK
ncbi:MAG: BrnA antitoxin family protein [Clostridiaceae bacterium]|jgi:predicted DNA binding CopG/RHH family protein|nr:BrnA antitoxin family protein [Clostridiaceae bacterium]